MSTPNLPTLALRPKDLLFITKAAKLFVPDYDVVVYGSRAMGTSRPDSDLDIGVFGSTENIDRDIADFDRVLQHSSVMPIVTVAEMHLVRGAFLQQVLQFGVLLQEGSGEFRRLRLANGYGTPAFEHA